MSSKYNCFTQKVRYECHFMLSFWGLLLILSFRAYIIYWYRWPGGTRIIWPLSATAVREDSGWPLENITAGKATSQTATQTHTSTVFSLFFLCTSFRVRCISVDSFSWRLWKTSLFSSLKFLCLRSVSKQKHLEKSSMVDSELITAAVVNTAD